ncbi:MAG: AEC family transporter [Candidatus Brocadiia bacterium]
MTTVIQILYVLIPILMGLAFRLAKVFGDEEAEVLRSFVVRLCVPILVFFTMFEAERESVGSLPTMMLAFVLVGIGLFTLGWLCSKSVEGIGRKTAVHASTTFGNYGWMGFGVCEVLLGQAGLQQAIFFIVLWWPVFYTLGVPIGLIHARRNKKGVPLVKAIKVASPVIGMMLLGLIFNFCGVKIPDLIRGSLKPFEKMTVPLILFSVGTMLDFSRIHRDFLPSLLVSAATLVGGALIGWGVAEILNPDGISYNVIILEAAMPVATLTPILAENYKMNTETVGTCIVVSTVLSLVSLPILAIILGL